MVKSLGLLGLVVVAAISMGAFKSDAANSDSKDASCSCCQSGEACDATAKGADGTIQCDSCGCGEKCDCGASDCGCLSGEECTCDECTCSECTCGADDDGDDDDGDEGDDDGGSGSKPV